MVGIGRIAQYGGGFGRIGRKGKIVNFIEAGKPIGGFARFQVFKHAFYQHAVLNARAVKIGGTGYEGR